MCFHVLWSFHMHAFDLRLYKISTIVYERMQRYPLPVTNVMWPNKRKTIKINSQLEFMYRWSFCHRYRVRCILTKAAKGNPVTKKGIEDEPPLSAVVPTLAKHRAHTTRTCCKQIRNCCSPMYLKYTRQYFTFNQANQCIWKQLRLCTRKPLD